MSPGDVMKLIGRLFLNVAEDLWRLNVTGPGQHGLVFPRYVKNEQKCITEKPASHLFGRHAAKVSEISYAPEAPTKGQNYGKGKRSSLCDWRIYDASNGEGLANIEFKFGTGGDVACDMRKLIVDGLEGAWFCTIKSGYAVAFNCIFVKLRRALEDVLPPNGNTSGLTIAICVLNPRELISRSFEAGSLTAQTAKVEFAECKWSSDSWEKASPDGLTPDERYRIESRKRQGLRRPGHGAVNLQRKGSHH